MRNLSMFTDAEVYILKRAFTESSFEFFMTDKYGKASQDMHTKLFNEFIQEDTKRIHAMQDCEPKPVDILTKDDKGNVIL